jgi:hypothetical protein
LAGIEHSALHHDARERARQRRVLDLVDSVSTLLMAVKR